MRAYSKCRKSLKILKGQSESANRRRTGLVLLAQTPPLSELAQTPLLVNSWGHASVVDYVSNI